MYGNYRPKRKFIRLTTTSDEGCKRLSTQLLSGNSTASDYTSISKVDIPDTALTVDAWNLAERCIRDGLFGLQCTRSSTKDGAAAQLIEYHPEPRQQVIVGDDVDNTLGIAAKYFKLTPLRLG